MDPATLAALIGPVADLFSKQYDIAFEVLFGDEKRRKAAALEDATRINPWLTPAGVITPAQDNTLLIVVIATAFLFLMVMVMAYAKGNRQRTD